MAGWTEGRMKHSALPVALAAVIAIALCCLISTQMNGEIIHLEDAVASAQDRAPYPSDVDEFMGDDVENRPRGLVNADMSDDMTAEEKALVEAADGIPAVEKHTSEKATNQGSGEHKETKLLSVQKGEKASGLEDDLTPEEKELIWSAREQIVPSAGQQHATDMNKMRKANVHATAAHQSKIIQKWVHMLQLPNDPMPSKSRKEQEKHDSTPRTPRSDTAASPIRHKHPEKEEAAAVAQDSKAQKQHSALAASEVVQETPVVNLDHPVPKNVEPKKSSILTEDDGNSEDAMEASMERITKAATKRAVHAQTKNLHSSPTTTKYADHVPAVSARELILNRLANDMPPLQQAEAKAAEIRLKYQEKIKNVHVKSTWAQKLADADRRVMQDVKAEMVPLTQSQLQAAKELRTKLGH